MSFLLFHNKKRDNKKKDVQMSHSLQVRMLLSSLSEIHAKHEVILLSELDKSLSLFYHFCKYEITSTAFVATGLFHVGTRGIFCKVDENKEVIIMNWPTAMSC